MWELDHTEGWTSKSWCFWNMVLEKTLESPLDCKEVKPVNPKGNQPWIFIGRTDAEAEAPILLPPDANSWLTGKDPDVSKDWRQEEKGTTEDEVAGWHHQLYGSEFEWTLGVGDGQRDLASCSPCGHKGSDMTEQLNWTELNWTETNCQVIREVEVESCGHEMCWHKSWIKLPFSPMIVHPELLINIFRVAEMSLPLTI